MGSTPELPELFHRVSHRLRHGYRVRLDPLGINPSQARALRVLLDAAEPMNMVRLAEALRIVPRSLTPVVDALEEAGLVRRRIDPANRRSTLVVVTEEGDRTAREIVAAREEAARELFSVLSPAQQDQLKSLLSTLDAD